MDLCTTNGSPTDGLYSVYSSVTICRIFDAKLNGNARARTHARRSCQVTIDSTKWPTTVSGAVAAAVADDDDDEYITMASIWQRSNIQLAPIEHSQDSANAWKGFASNEIETKFKERATSTEAATADRTMTTIACLQLHACNPCCNNADDSRLRLKRREQKHSLFFRCFFALQF